MYTPKEKEDLFEAICLRIEAGESLRKVLSKKGALSKTVFYDLLNDKTKNERYARACEIRADALFDEIIQISDNRSKAADVNRDRLRVDARKWALSKMQPKKYGDRLDVEHSGALSIEWKETKTYDTDQKTD